MNQVRTFLKSLGVKLRAVKENGLTTSYNLVKGNKKVPINSFFRRFNNRYQRLNEQEISNLLYSIGVDRVRSGMIYRNRIFKLEDIRKELRKVPTKFRKPKYKYFEDVATGLRIYYINNLNLQSSEIESIMIEITERINQALETGFTDNADVNISFTLFNEGIYTVKVFNSFLIKNLSGFVNTLRSYVELNASQFTNYSYNIEKMTIKLVKESSGGCNEGNKDRRRRVGDVRFINPRSSNNNCLFACLKGHIDIGEHKGKALYKRRNDIRHEYKLEKDSPIPISIALKMYEKYKPTSQRSIGIIDMDTKITHGEINPNILLKQQNGHYEIVEQIEKKTKCEKCLKLHSNRVPHTCNSNRLSYVNNKIKKTGDRSLITNVKKEENNTSNQLIHYDIETYRKMNSEGVKICTCYIVGYNEGDEFKYFSGENSISLFVDRILELSEHTALYINAFNGANFDHYALRAEFLRRGIKPQKEIINNGSIIKFEYKNIKLFDLCKHLTGSLDANLQDFGCEVQKGTFNHNDERLLNGWEGMSQDLRDDCLKYLKGDVMGLKELYEKLNKEIFDKFGYNLTSYISTSSLSFNLWKENINGKHYIKLPTLGQEKAFRKSVRGGRTYKSKHKFISKQYHEFKSGRLEFNEIDDYVIDADVVSLYPTAMANYEYPVGDCHTLSFEEGRNGEKQEMKGVMGIYYIKYITNKNLQHSIGGRRDEKTGALHWDLKDSEGWYSSVDIQDMIDNGYKIEISTPPSGGSAGYYWTEKAYIFKDYINQMFEKKKNSKKGTVSYTLAKLFMNSLYGKMIQRPIYTNTEIIQTNSDYWKFWSKNIITSIDKLGDNWVVSGTSKEEIIKERCITKPTHLGSFILAYSRRIMLNYMKESNPYFSSPDLLKRSENDIYYTDTDSLQMHCSNAKLMKNLGNKELGGITDDLGDDCKIIKGLWIAPKLYMLEYVKRGDKKIYYHFRGKGLNAEDLSVEKYEAMDKGESLINIRPFQMKKVNVKRNSKQQNINQFSIIYLENIKKEVNSTLWNGRNFKDNTSIPWI